MREIQQFKDNENGIAPVTGVILMLAVTVVMAAIIGAFVFGLGGSLNDPEPDTMLDVEYNATADIIKITHTGGDVLHPEDAQYMSVTSDNGVDVAWNHLVLNTSKRTNTNEAVIEQPITAGTTLVAVSDINDSEKASLNWIADTETSYTLVGDIGGSVGTTVNGDPGDGLSIPPQTILVSGVSGDIIDVQGTAEPTGLSSNGEPELTFIGDTREVTSTETWSGVSDGDSISPTIDGSESAAEVTLTGEYSSMSLGDWADWSVEPTSSPSYYTPPNAVAKDTSTGTVLVGTDRGGVAGIAESDGSDKYLYSNYPGLVYDIAVDEDQNTAYAVGDNGELHAITADSGAGEWTLNVAGSTTTGVAVSDDGTVFVTAGQEVYAVNPDTQTTEWTYTGSIATNYKDVVVDSSTGTVFAAGGYQLVAIDAGSGGEQWTHEIGASTDAGEALGVDVDETRGTVYVSTAGADGDTMDGEVHAVNAKTGDKRWDFGEHEASYQFSTDDVSDITVEEDSGVVFTATDESVMYAIAPDGTEIALASSARPNQNGIAVDSSAQHVYITAEGGEVDMHSWTGDGVDSPEVDINDDGTAEISHSGVLAPGDTVTQSFDPTTVANTWDVNTTTGTVTVSVQTTATVNVTDPTVDIDGDGTAEATASGEIADGETVTVELAELTTGEQTVSLTSATEVIPNWEIEYVEEES